MSNRKMFLIMCSCMVSSAFGADASKLHFGLAAVGAGLAVIGAGIGIGNILEEQQKQPLGSRKQLMILRVQ